MRALQPYSYKSIWMRKEKRSTRWLGILGLLGMLSACFCLLIVFGVSFGFIEADIIIGSASPNLEPLDRIYLAGYLILFAKDLDTPAGNASNQHELVIEQGQNAAHVVAQLKEAKIITNELLLRNYLQFRGFDTGIEAGIYSLHAAMTPREIADTLQRANPQEIKITVLEGWRREQIAQAVALSGLVISESEFATAADRPLPGYAFSEYLPPFASLEGFLFPDTYLVDSGITADELVQLMLKNFEVRIGADFVNGYNVQGINLFQAAILASIVEREAVVDDERELIASVFYNRLRQGIKLEADPTIQYALGLQVDGSWWKAPLTLEDLKFDSLFNTYLYPDFPPGPIANPGLEAMRAVAFPLASDFLYFRAACDQSGRHFFSMTFEEHQSNACD